MTPIDIFVLVWGPLGVIGVAVIVRAYGRHVDRRS